MGDENIHKHNMSMDHFQEYIKEALSVLMLCAPDNRLRPLSYHTKMVDFEYFLVLSAFL